MIHITQEKTKIASDRVVLFDSVAGMWKTMWGGGPTQVTPLPGLIIYIYMIISDIIRLQTYTH